MDPGSTMLKGGTDLGRRVKRTRFYYIEEQNRPGLKCGTDPGSTTSKSGTDLGSTTSKEWIRVPLRRRVEQTWIKEWNGLGFHYVEGWNGPGFHYVPEFHYVEKWNQLGFNYVEGWNGLRFHYVEGWNGPGFHYVVRWRRRPANDGSVRREEFDERRVPANTTELVQRYRVVYFRFCG